ncbi:MAG: hypothetical protein IPK26_20615 [Planctomycetes bacterium]|nr:hypothetical protein [Planctomycetota bacterium]
MNHPSPRCRAIPFALAFALAAAGLSAQAPAVVFHRLDAQVTPGIVDVGGISADGRVVVGRSTGPSASLRATAWTGGQAADLGLPPGTTRAFPRATDFSGQTVVGDVSFATNVAHRWVGSAIQVLPNTRRAASPPTPTVSRGPAT